jgi:hypothetical protein
MSVIGAAPDYGVPEGAVHALDLSGCPGVARPSEVTFDVILGTGEFQGIRPEDLASFHGLFDQNGCRTDFVQTGEVGTLASQ